MENRPAPEHNAMHQMRWNDPTLIKKFARKRRAKEFWMSKLSMMFLVAMVSFSGVARADFSRPLDFVSVDCMGENAVGDEEIGPYIAVFIKPAKKNGVRLSSVTVSSMDYRLPAFAKLTAPALNIASEGTLSIQQIVSPRYNLVMTGWQLEKLNRDLDFKAAKGKTYEVAATLQFDGHEHKIYSCTIQM